MTINSLGVVTNVQDYYAYGEVLRSYNNSTPNEKYKFTGKERDTETDLDYFGARFYDSELGRWTSIDPLADSHAGWSPYTYCLNRPLNLIDPFGFDEWDPNKEQFVMRENVVTADRAPISDRYINFQKTTPQRDKVGEIDNQKTKENNLNFMSDLVTTFGFTFDTQLALFKYAGEVESGTAIYLNGFKLLGVFFNYWAVIDDYNYMVNNPSLENQTKFSISLTMALLKAQPEISAVKGFADVTGISKPVYQIPSAINNGFDQIARDMINLLIPRGF